MLCIILLLYIESLGKPGERGLFTAIACIDEMAVSCHEHYVEGCAFTSQEH